MLIIVSYFYNTSTSIILSLIPPISRRYALLRSISCQLTLHLDCYNCITRKPTVEKSICTHVSTYLHLHAYAKLQRTLLSCSHCSRYSLGVLTLFTSFQNEISCWKIWGSLLPCSILNGKCELGDLIDLIKDKMIPCGDC